MVEILKRQLKVQRENGLAGLAMIMGAGILGFIMVHAILFMTPDEKNYVALGTILGGVVAVFFTGAMIMASLSLYFNIEVAMGCTRKQFFASYFAVSLLFCIAGFALLVPICAAENAVSAALRPDLENVVDFLPHLVRWGIPAAVVLTVFSILCGAILMRFGRVARWILLALWLFLCIGGPRIADAMTDAPKSVFGRLGNGAAAIITAVSPWVWAIAAVILSLAGGICAYAILRRQQVNS